MATDRELLMERMPRWAKAFVGAAIVAGGGLVVWVALDDGDASPAEWRIEPGTVLDADIVRLPVEVREAACASGRSAEGRIVAEVIYEVGSVVVDIEVRPRSGSQDCQSNPVTRFVVELDEPLGSRRIVGERWSE